MTSVLAPRPILLIPAWPWLELVARWALASPFLISGLTKLTDFAGATAEVAALGLQPAAWTAGAVILTQLAGSTLVLTRRFCWIGAILLGGFMLVATLLAHPFWASGVAERGHQVATFFEHVGLVGGVALAALFVHRGQAPS